MELLNFADDIVRGGNCQKRTVFKNLSDALFINLIKVDGLGPHFLLANNLKRWCLVLQRSRTSSKCFKKLNWESKVIPRNFHFEDSTFSVSPYSFRLDSVFSGEYRPGEYNHFGFCQDFSLILHLAHNIAKFRGSCCKKFAAKRTFKLKSHCAVSSANWDREFCLWCSVRRSIT